MHSLSRSYQKPKQRSSLQAIALQLTQLAVYLQANSLFILVTTIILLCDTYRPKTQRVRVKLCFTFSSFLLLLHHFINIKFYFDNKTSIRCITLRCTVHTFISRLSDYLVCLRACVGYFVEKKKRFFFMF